MQSVPALTLALVHATLPPKALVVRAVVAAEQAVGAAVCPSPGLDLTSEPQLLVLGAPALSGHLVFSEHLAPADAADCCQPLLQQAPVQLAGVTSDVQQVCLARVPPAAGQPPVAAAQMLGAAAQTPVAADQALVAAAQTPVAADQPFVVPEQSENAGLAVGAAEVAAAAHASSADAAACPAAACPAAADPGQVETAVLVPAAVAADQQWDYHLASGCFAVAVAAVGCSAEAAQDPGAAAATAVVHVDCPAERMFASAAAADSSPAAVAALPDAQAAVLSACDAVVARMPTAAAELLVGAVLATFCRAGFAHLAAEAARQQHFSASPAPVAFAQTSAGAAGEQQFVALRCLVALAVIAADGEGECLNALEAVALLVAEKQHQCLPVLRLVSQSWQLPKEAGMCRCCSALPAHLSYLHRPERMMIGSQSTQHIGH